MRLVQYRTEDGDRRVAMVESEESLHVLNGTERVYDLARGSRAQRPSPDRARRRAVARSAGRIQPDCGRRQAPPAARPPRPHPSRHQRTGLDHLGSAQARDAMHQNLNAEEEETLTDSMRMFRMGLEGGKPRPDRSVSHPSGSIRAMAAGSCRRDSR